MKSSKEDEKKEEEADESEDWCFVCKDGGDLLLCDYPGCIKVYHPECVGRKKSVMKSEERWTCSWHTCSECNKTSKFLCLCCPTGICRFCIRTASFAIVKGNLGFCSTCLELAICIEENAELNTAGEKMDLEDRDTYECRFKEYLLIIMEKENLTRGDIYCTMDASEESSSEDDGCSSVGFAQGTKDDILIVTSSDSDYVKRRKQTRKRKVFTRKEFIGWGSRPLIDFLKSIDIDTSKMLTQYEVDSIISKYIAEKQLIDKKRKNFILCDEMLYSIFKKKSLRKSKIYNLLEDHIAENLEHSEESETESSSENNIEMAWLARKKRKVIESKAESSENKLDGVQKSLFVSIVVDNMKLVYLRKSLLEKLLSQPGNVEDKVVGSFVKLKKDPREKLWNLSCKLVQVKGIKKLSSGETNTEILLQVNNMVSDVGLSLLSDDDISEEECEGLRQQVKNGLLEKPTVVEFEQKARSLHEDIMKHWIEMELVRLQKLVDFANIKGWRREYPFGTQTL